MYGIVEGGMKGSGGGNVTLFTGAAAEVRERKE